MKRLIFFILLIFTATIFSGCLPTNQAEQAIDLIVGNPRIKNTSPQDGTKRVNLDSKIIIEFNKEINPETLNNKNIVIEYLDDDNFNFYINPFLASKYNYDSNTKILTIEPADKFLPNQEIEVKLLSDIKSKEGKELARTSESRENDNIRYVFRFKTTTE